MVWTPLAYDPPPPARLAGKPGAGQAGLEMLGSIIKFMGFLTGANKTPENVIRGFVGVELKYEKDNVVITAVLGKSPAAAAGLKVGDQIVEINGKAVRSLDDVRRLTAEVVSGKMLPLVVRRGGENISVRVIMGDGV